MDLFRKVQEVGADSVHFIDAQYDGEDSPLKQALEEKGFACIEAQFPHIKTELRERDAEKELFEFIEELMKFPYFGKNWDALIDCMSDMAWWPAKGYVLILYGAGKIWCEQPLLIGHFVEVWLICVRRWMERKKPVPFHLVFAFD